MVRVRKNSACSAAFGAQLQQCLPTGARVPGGGYRNIRHRLRAAIDGGFKHGGVEDGASGEDAASPQRLRHA